MTDRTPESHGRGSADEKIPHSGNLDGSMRERPVREFDNTGLNEAEERGYLTTPDSPEHLELTDEEIEDIKRRREAKQKNAEQQSPYFKVDRQPESFLSFVRRHPKSAAAVTAVTGLAVVVAGKLGWDNLQNTNAIPPPQTTPSASAPVTPGPSSEATPSTSETVDTPANPAETEQNRLREQGKEDEDRFERYRALEAASEFNELSLKNRAFAMAYEYHQIAALESADRRYFDQEIRTDTTFACNPIFLAAGENGQRRINTGEEVMDMKHFAKQAAYAQSSRLNGPLDKNKAEQMINGVVADPDNEKVAYLGNMREEIADSETGFSIPTEDEEGRFDPRKLPVVMDWKYYDLEYDGEIYRAIDITYLEDGGRTYKDTNIVVDTEITAKDLDAVPGEDKYKTYEMALYLTVASERITIDS